MGGPRLLLPLLWGPSATLVMTLLSPVALAFKFCQPLPAPFSLVTEGRALWIPRGSPTPGPPWSLWFP